MPKQETHYLVIKEAMEQVAAHLWEKYNNFAGFGSFSPDLFYVLLSDHIPHLRFSSTPRYEKVSDAIHGDGSLDFYCSMLDDIKHTGQPMHDKLKAFAYGFYSHVVT